MGVEKNVNKRYFIRFRSRARNRDAMTSSRHSYITPIIVVVIWHENQCPLGVVQKTRYESRKRMAISKELVGSGKCDRSRLPHARQAPLSMLLGYVSKVGILGGDMV